MLDELLNIISKNYSLVYRDVGDEFGIPLCQKDDKTLYVRKLHSKLLFFTKSGGIRNGIDECFTDREIVISAGELNKCFDDIQQKVQYFGEVLSLIGKYSDVIDEQSA